MRRQNKHAYHDLSKPEPKPQRDWVPPDIFGEWKVPDAPQPSPTADDLKVSERLASLQVKRGTGAKLIDRIPGPQVPDTLGLGGNSREPVPEIPEERELAQAVVDEANEGLFRTFQDTCPPPADCQYTVVDQGVSGPDFFRCSLYNVPYTEKLRKLSQLPLSLYLRPFAEAEVPLADFSQWQGEDMPPRCHRCRAYMNPSMRFVNGGSKFVCNLCGFVNETPHDYYQPTGPDGRRLDWEERPELAFGTYDFVVVPASSDARKGSDDSQGQGDGQGDGAAVSQLQSSYASTTTLEAPEKPSVYGSHVPLEFRRVFCCECSKDAVQKHIVKLFADSVIAALPFLGKHDRIAIMTFDSHVNYFRLDAFGRTQMLVSSASAPVVPPDVYMDPVAKRDDLVKMLENLPEFFKDTSDRNSCLGTALQTVLEQPNALHGGRVTTVFSGLPSVGPSKLMVRDQAIAGVTSPELPVHKELFEPSASFYKDLARKLGQHGWGCDLLAIPTSGYIDVANVERLATESGGRFFYYPRFVADRDSRRVMGDLLSIVSAPMQARNTSLKIRTSTGLQIDKMCGAGDGVGSFLDSDSTIVATASFDGQLDPKLDAHFQAAVLYTAPNGEKRIRVCNLLTGVTSKFKSLVKFVHADVVLATIVRQTVDQMGKHSTLELRAAVMTKIESIFGAVRRHAGQGMPLSQLLMPTNLRQLLMMGLSLTKTISLGSRAFSSDARAVNAVYLREATVDQLAVALYPRIYDIGTISADERPMVRARFQDLLLGSRAFLVFDGQQFYIWLGEGVSPNTLEKLFGVRALEKVSPWLDELPVLDTDASKEARRLCGELALRVDRSWLPVQIVRQKLDGAEYQLRQLMVEDTINDSPSYINYVVRVHQRAKAYNDKEGWF